MGQRAYWQPAPQANCYIAEVPLRPELEVYELAEANRALRALRFGPIRGAKVLLFDNLKN